jgi:hypothetical protein
MEMQFRTATGKEVTVNQDEVAHTLILGGVANPKRSKNAGQPGLS